MYWWLLAAGVIFYIGRAMWRAHKHPSTKLGVQAAGLGWGTLGHIKDNAGYSKHRVGRGPYEALILFRTGEVQLIQPEVQQPFNDFIEVDRWIREFEQDAKETDPEALYIRSVEAVVQALGRLTRLRQIEETDECFALSVSMACTMAFGANVSHKVVGHLVRDAVNHYENDPALAIAFLDSLVSKWRPAAFQKEAVPEDAEPCDLEDTFHPALDRGVEMVRGFLESPGARTGLSGHAIQLKAELLVYAASFIAMKRSSRELYPSEWNTFKAGIENRMLSIKDDGSERSRAEENPDGSFVLSHCSSGYWTQMDGLDWTDEAESGPPIKSLAGSKPARRLYGASVECLMRRKSSQLRTCEQPRTWLRPQINCHRTYGPIFAMRPRTIFTDSRRKSANLIEGQLALRTRSYILACCVQRRNTQTECIGIAPITNGASAQAKTPSIPGP